MSGEDPLYLTVHLRPLAEARVEARLQLQRMIDASRLEEGCEAMEFVALQDDADEWMVFERWASRPLWEAHASTERNAAEGAILDTMLDRPLTLRFYSGA